MHQFGAIILKRVPAEGNGGGGLVKSRRDAFSMRTTISIPNEFYNKIKERMARLGFTSINDFLLDLLRHQIDEEMDIKKSDSTL